MPIRAFLLLSSIPMLVLFASAVRGDTGIDFEVFPTGGLSDPRPKYSCCDEKYRSECCGTNGCICCGLCAALCNHDCCGKVCRSTIEEVTEERSCWKVACEEICVPRVVCPWGEGGSGLTIFNWLKKHRGGCGDTCDSCCDGPCGKGSCSGNGCCLSPRCGDVRCVRVLEREDYEVTECRCKWDLENGCFRYGPGCGCAGGCCCGK